MRCWRRDNNNTFIIILNTSGKNLEWEFQMIGILGTLHYLSLYMDAGTKQSKESWMNTRSAWPDVWLQTDSGSLC